METKRIQGVIPPMVTPFQANEDVDLDALRTEAAYLFSTGIDGIGIAGSTGEGALLSNDEIRMMIEVVCEENTAGLPVIAGVIRNSTRDAIATALVAKEAGADALLVTPSFYHGATADGNYEYYRAIGERVGLPMIVYNVVPTNQISPELMVKIRELEQIIGIKQVGVEELSAMMTRCGALTKVFSACDDMLYGTYIAGACGTIAAIATVAPVLCVQQWQAFQAGDQQTAQEIHQKLARIVAAYFERPFPGNVKEAINQQGRPAGKARSPILAPSPERKALIRDSLLQAGLL